MVVAGIILPLTFWLGRRARNAEKAIDSTNDGYWVLNGNGDIVDVNAGYCRMVGHTREQILRMCIADFEEVATMPRIRAQIRRIMDRGHEQFETRHRHSDGHWVDLEITVTRVDRNHLVAFLRDIGSRKTSERALLEARNVAEAANLAKSRFLANMSHEIRTPLNAVIGLSRLMQDTTLNTEQQLLNEKLLISGENLLGIINEILDFSKIEAGRVELEAIPFNLNDVLARVYSFLSHAAEKKSINLNAGMDKPFQKAVIGDPIRLQQILTNLVNNAIKFTSSGGVDIACTLVGESAGKAAFRFMVSDTGIGISEENLKNIFEKFKQEDESVTRIYGGTGLGLAISRQLVGLMGGELRVESEKGAGSRFFFTLEYDTTDVAVLREANRKIYIDQEALKGKKILVVEDNEFNQFIAHSILTKWNIATDMASNGKEAIEKLKEKNYDLILMDMQMPVLDGCTATRIIRNELSITTQIIALTAFATKDAIEKSIEAGMNGYITKPFDEETLFSQLLSAFNITPRYITEPGGTPLAGIPETTGQGCCYDLDMLAGLFGDDKAEILDIIEKFIELTPDYADALFAAYDQNNIPEVARAAHKIKSSLELIATGHLRNNIRLIHDYAQTNQNLGELPDLLKYLRNNIPILLLQLTDKVKEMKSEVGNA